MEFESLVSSSKAIDELNRRLGLSKPVPRPRKDSSQLITEGLSKSLNLGKRILKNLQKISNNQDLVFEYKTVLNEFIVISEKILKELGVD